MSNRNKLIERYVSNDMSPSEAKKFEETMANDQGLASEVKLWKEVDQAVADDSLQKFVDTLSKIRRELNYSQL